MTLLYSTVPALCADKSRLRVRCQSSYLRDVSPTAYNPNFIISLAASVPYFTSRVL